MSRSRTAAAIEESRVAAAVELHSIAQRLGGHWALRGVTLRVEPGELIAIVGPNGSGKTTLLRVVATALRLTRGSGRVHGFDLATEPDAVRAGVAMLAHHGGVYADLTAAENLAFALRMLGQHPDATSIADALAWAGIGHAADARVKTFSSGMQRRLALAAVHLRRAPLLLMDEPYNSLDTAGGALIDELLERTRASGGAALVVLHDLGRSEVTFDRVVELSAGRVAEDRHVRGAPRVALVGAGGHA